MLNAGMDTKLTTVSNEEKVARVLHRDWVVGNRLQLGAFALRPNETYISVNRPAVDSFDSDVLSFVESHPTYQYSDGSYRCAMLGVQDIREIKVNLNDEPLNVDVEVEPRALHTASHAGIFTRIGETNIKKGGTIPPKFLPLGVSADDVLMEVGWSLIAIASVKEVKYN